MIIQRAGVFKFLRYLSIFCAVTMGLFSMVACSEDDVEDAVLDAGGVPESANTTFEFVPITVTKVGGAGINPSLVKTGCADTTIQAEINNSDLDQELIDRIATIQFTQLDILYTSVPAPDGTKGELVTCTLTIDYPAGTPVTIGSAQILHPSETLTGLAVPQTAMDTVNYYLNKEHWAENLHYCVSCTDQDVIQDYLIDMTPRFNVTVSR